jgi:Helix-loop-helix DNA-binding domain
MTGCCKSQAAMDTLDSLTLMDGCEENADQPYKSALATYQTGAFTMSDLQEIEPETISSNRTSQSIYPSQSYSIPAEIQTGQSSLPSQSAKVCPLLAGQTFQCIPQLCGPDAACLDFSSIPEIEECASVPCITHNSPELAQTSQPPPVSIPDPVPLRSSKSQFKKPTRNSQQRTQRENPENSDAKSVAKKAHSLVERRYRENLNGNIAQLHLALLKTKRASSTTPQNQDNDLEEQWQAFSKVRKSDVMLEAVEYVHQTEVELRHMTDEIELLTERVRQLEKLVKCEDCLLMKQLVSFNL